MPSVKVDGIVRISGETVIAAHGKNVILRDAEIHILRVRNLRKRKAVTISYTNADRRRLKLTVEPGKSVGIELPPLTIMGRTVKVGDLHIDFSVNEVETNGDDDEVVICPKCKRVLEPYEVGYCPICGDGE